MALKKRQITLLYVVPVVVFVLASIAHRSIEATFICAALVSALVFLLLVKIESQARWLSLAVSIGLVISVDGFRLLSSVTISAIVVPVFFVLPGGRRFNEDDYYYLPAVIFVLVMFLVLCLSSLLHSGGAPVSFHSAVSDLFSRVKGEIDAIVVSASEQDKKTLERLSELLDNPGATHIAMGILFALYSVLFFFLGRTVRRRMGGGVRPPDHFVLLRTNERYVFILIFGILAEIIGHVARMDSLFYVSRCTLVILCVFYYLVGLSIVTYVLVVRAPPGKRPFPLILKVLLVCLVVITFQICMLIGVLDIWFNFRKIGTVQEA